MKPPHGFQSTKSNQVCRLRKSLYGLKQTSHCWFEKLANSLKVYGFRQSYSDYSFFTLYRSKIQINVLVYVDDLLISGNESAAVTVLKKYLIIFFRMKDLGVLKYFLGIEVARRYFFSLSTKYTLDIWSKTN